MACFANIDHKVGFFLKRIWALLLILALLTGLAACSGNETEPSATQEPTVEPAVEALAPTAAADPLPWESEEDGGMTGENAQQALTGSIGDGENALDPSFITTPPLTLSTDPPEGAQEAEPDPEPENDSYTYTSLTNNTLQVKFLYPEGWISDPTTDTITMVEPVEEGDVPARFSVSSFAYTYSDKELSNKRLKNHLSEFLEKMVSGYNEYQLGAAGYNRTFADSTAIYVEYLAIKGNAYISGIAMVGYGKNGRVYFMHFCCEQDDYAGFADLIDRLASYVTPING